MTKTKRISSILILALIVCIVLSTVLVACNKNKGGKVHSDPEQRPLSMSIQTPDGVFNPFFSTSAYDSSIVSMTQIGMLSTDKKGNIIAGLDEPTAVLAFKVTEHKNTAGTDTDYTDYEFLIKNGMKFSDGQPITIKDVLFNLYVYLDPAFTGSATIYSTDIRGLSAYRTQNESANEESMGGFEQNRISEANMALNKLKQYVSYFGKNLPDGVKRPARWQDGSTYDAPGNKGYLDNVNYVASLFKNELTSDWNGINMTDYEKWGYENSGKFTEPWQVFLLNDMGDTTILKRENDVDSQPFEKNNDGNYILNEDKAKESLREVLKGYDEAVTLEQVDAMESNARMEYIKNACIEAVFRTAFPEFTVDIVTAIDQPATTLDRLPTSADNALTETYHINAREMSYTQFDAITSYWGSASTFFDYLVAQAKTDYFNKFGDSLAVARIDGITAYSTESFTGKQSSVATAPDVTISGHHDVLKIRVNKVDPKAIYNFSFTVAPMHYYSDEPHVDDVNKDWAKLGSSYTEEEFNATIKHFGVEYGSIDFMNDIVNAPSKVGVPIGGGAYKATNASDGSNPTGTGANGFFNSNMIYYLRNDNFWTLGSDGGSQADSKLQNAVIKHVRYKVVDADKIINSVGKDIDIGDPGATQENIAELAKNGSLTVVKTMTAGYGYIGVNPRYVPNVTVRRAIMKAMDVDLMINNYYKGELASRILRPMSKVSWAYPDNAEIYAWDNTADYHNLKFDSTGQEIDKLMKELKKDPQHTVTTENGVYKVDGQLLDYKFTIAGGSVDHPAYATFLKAAGILNNHGFKIQVVTSQTALSDLSAGKLAVWAAAWSSTIDPDMYQVYHKDSQASSTSNWGYKQIKADTNKYRYENGIINQLSAKIDEARTKTDQASRKDDYAVCLDLVMALAVELPTYQRNDLTAYNSDVIDSSSLPVHNTGDEDRDEVSPYYGLFTRLWEVRYY